MTNSSGRRDSEKRETEMKSSMTKRATNPTFPHPPAPPMGGDAGGEFLELSNPHAEFPASMTATTTTNDTTTTQRRP